MGRPAKPTHLKILHGDRKDRINTQEPQFKTDIPTPPTHIPPEARKVWETVTEELGRYDLVTVPDGPSLEAYVMAVFTHRKAARDVVKRGVMVKGYRGSIVKNPALSVMSDAADKIKVFAREFGLTPSSRSGLKVQEVAGADKEALLS